MTDDRPLVIQRCRHAVNTHLDALKAKVEAAERRSILEMHLEAADAYRACLGLIAAQRGEIT
jgi:hypothetical protein